MGVRIWQDFSADGRLDEASIYEQVGSTWAENSDFSFLHFTDKIGSLSVTHSLEPGEEKTFTFILTWYFPNRPKMWIQLDKDRDDINAGNYQVTKNYYATLFTDAWEAAAYLGNERERLYSVRARHFLMHFSAPRYRDMF